MLETGIDQHEWCEGHKCLLANQKVLDEIDRGVVTGRKRGKVTNSNKTVSKKIFKQKGIWQSRDGFLGPEILSTLAAGSLFIIIS